MRVVADTNVVISGLLWKGPPREILNAGRKGNLQLFTNGLLLEELRNVLRRQKFLSRLKPLYITPQELVLGYAALTSIVKAIKIEPTILDDPDDDEVLACAVSARADAIVSGDRHLLAVKEYRSISIHTASEFKKFYL